MLREATLLKKFKTVFEPPQAAVLAQTIVEAYTDLVNTSDFNELKAVVKRIADAQERTDQKMGELADAQKRTDQKMGELADAQKRTDQKMGELADAQKRTDQRIGDLADAQKRTDQRIGDLADAQKRTDQKMGELADAQKHTDQKMAEMAQSIKSLADAQERLANAQERLTDALSDTRSEVGGLSRSMSYALENEAYRLLPEFLRQQHGIEMTERLIRTEIGGEEINFFGKAIYQGKSVVMAGETKLRLDERRESRQAEHKILETLNRKIDAVRAEYPDETILPLLVTHYARPAFVKKAQAQGIVLVQSFEW